MSKNVKKIQGDETTHYVSERKKRAKPAPKMQPPLTPMIDVTFQLLLFFLLTMTFREAEGQILGTLPSQGGPSPTTDILKGRIDIVIYPLGTKSEGARYEIGNIAIDNDPKELSDQLMAAAKSYNVKDTTVRIEPKVSVKWEFVLEAYNQAVKAKFKNVNFAPLQ